MWVLRLKYVPLFQSTWNLIKILCVRHPTPWVSQLYCKSVHISLILLILSLFDETFDFLMFKKLVFKVCFYFVGSFHRTVAYLIFYWSSLANLKHTPHTNKFLHYKRCEYGLSLVTSAILQYSVLVESYYEF